MKKHQLLTMGRTLLIGLLLSLAGLANAQDLAEIKARGVLRHLGTPYANFVTGGGAGLDVEIIQQFAQHLGVRYEFVPTDWRNMIPDLIGADSKQPIRGDVAASGITILPSRTAVLDFSIPIFPTAVWLAATKHSKINPIKPSGNLSRDIQETKERMHQGTTLVSDVGCLDPKLYGLLGKGYRLQDIKSFPDLALNDMIPAMLKGLTDMSMLDVPDLMVGMEKWPGQVKVIGPISEEQDTAAAFRKSSPALREAFNTFFTGMKKDGTYMKLVNKYYRAAPRYFPIFFKSLKEQR